MSKLEKLRILQEMKDPTLRMHRMLTERALAEAIDKLDVTKGEKGDAGEDGITPIKGKDYWTNEDIQAVIDYIRSQVRDGAPGKIGGKGEQGPQGIKGDQGYSPLKYIDYMTTEDVREIAKSAARLIAKTTKPFDVNAAIQPHLETFKKNLPDNDSILVSILKDPRLRILLHGGGGGSVGNSILTAGGTIDNSNTTFSFASKPTVVIVNGATYRENKGWSWLSPNITLDNPVGTGGDIYAMS